MSSTTSVTTKIYLDTSLGKRKAHGGVETYFLRLSSSPELPIEQLPKQLSPPRVLVKEALIPYTKKRYQCTHNGCDKSYTKPSRLTEHERSHTGHVSKRT